MLRAAKPSVSVAKSNVTLVEDCLKPQHRACLVLTVDRKPSKKAKAVIKALTTKCAPAPPVSTRATAAMGPWADVLGVVLNYGVTRYRGVKLVVVNQQHHVLTHEHLRKDGEEAQTLGISLNRPRAMLFKPPGLNALSATLGHVSAWEQRLHAVAAAFGHG